MCTLKVKYRGWQNRNFNRGIVWDGMGTKVLEVWGAAFHFPGSALFELFTGKSCLSTEQSAECGMKRKNYTCIYHTLQTGHQSLTCIQVVF